MKVYLAVPLQKNRNNTLAKGIYKILLNINCQILSEWVLWDEPNPNMEPAGIYRRNYEAIKSCDILLAEVSSPSIGVGMEIMLANMLRKKIICIYSKTEISNMVKGIPMAFVVRYNNLNDLSESLHSTFLKIIKR